MKLSILIPMYNAEDYINNCLNSLLNQGLETSDYEIIIMDDGSNDNSLKIATEFTKSHKNIFLYAEKNAGSDATRNKLLKLAKGDYIYFIDSDDYVASNSFGLLIDYMTANELDFIGFDTQEIKNLEATNLSKGISITDFSPTLNGLEYIRDHIHLRHEVWWYIVKRNLIFDNAITFDENGNNADVIFTIKLLLSTDKMSYCSVPIHRYVQSEESVMRVKSASQKRKLIDSMFLMIMSYSKLINKVSVESFNDKKKIIANLKHRRDVFAFFNIINMLREHYNFGDFMQRLLELSHVNAYPVKDFAKYHYKSLNYKLLSAIVNNKTALTCLVYVKNKLFTSKENYGEFDL